MVDAERAGRVAALGVQAHQPAVVLLAQRVAPQQPFGVRDGPGELAVGRAPLGELAQRVEPAPAQPMPLGVPARRRRGRPSGHRRSSATAARAAGPRCCADVSSCSNSSTSTRRLGRASATVRGVISRWRSRRAARGADGVQQLAEVGVGLCLGESGQSAAASRLRGWASGCSTR